MIKTVLFDLDGTLLPMDQDTFIKHYFGLLAKKLAPHGYDPQALIAGIWEGTTAMVKNDGSCTNEQAFWNCFCTRMGEHCRADEPLFEEYYRTDFQQVQAACGFAPEATQVIRTVREKGLKIVLATNPIFPAIATHSRIRWAGLELSDFAHVTTYENSCHCKPNLQYYRDIMDKLGLDPTQCLMVGNDVGEDMVAKELGMQVFLLTDCLINKNDTDISLYPHGSFPQLLEFLNNL